jgi:hypothetical protein
MYKLSRYWNRLAYLIIRIGRNLIWDQTGKNTDILTRNEFARKYTEDIMCDR